MFSRHALSSLPAACILAAVFAVTSQAQFLQQGNKLVSASSGAAMQGYSLALSANGNTLAVGGPADTSSAGAVWVYTRTNGAWSQGAKLVATGTVNGSAQQGWSVALSADGNTLVEGAPTDGADGFTGAAFVFTRANGQWTQQAQLIGNDAAGNAEQDAEQGASVALSADGNTVIVGGPADNSGYGAAWVFTRSNGAWSQQGAKLAGSGVTNVNGQFVAYEGWSVALSGDGNTAMLGGWAENKNTGAAWVFVRSNDTWTQQGNKLVASNPSAPAASGLQQGYAVALSADGSTALAGAWGDGAAGSKSIGAVWVFTRSNNQWTQQAKLIGTNPLGTPLEGWSVGVSGDGNTAVVGGYWDNNTGGQVATGAAWIFRRTGGAWGTGGTKIVGTGGTNGTDSGRTPIGPYEGWAVGISADGSTAAVGGVGDNSDAGAVWVFAQPHFTFPSPTPSTANSGVPFNFKVAMQDANNNPLTSYNGTVHFTSSDSSATLPADAALSGGTGAFSATLTSGGSQTLTATDTTNSGITGTSNAITVSGGATHFSISAPAAATSGTAFSFTVTAQDAGGNTIGGYGGTVQFGSSDHLAVLPANAKLSSGVGTFSATLKTAGSQTLSATDTVTSTLTGTSNAVAVSGGAATHLSLSAPSAAAIGTAFNFTATAQDAYGNTAKGYSGKVHFTSSDGQAVLPANSSLSSGLGTFSATLKTAGSQTISAADTVTSSVAGTSKSIAVSVTGVPATTHFSVGAPAAATTGTAFSVTVTALDANDSTVQAYSGTVHFSSTDTAALLPADSTLTNGSGTFSVTLETSGSQTITSSDTADTSVTGTSAAIDATAPPVPPNPVSVSPAGGTAAASQQMTFVFTDPRGYQDLGVLNILVNNFIDGRHACYLAYVVAQSTLFLVDDAGDAGGPFAGGVALGSSTPIHNSQCSVVLNSAQGNGNDFALVMTFTWTSSFAGDKIAYTAARDAVENNSGWYPLGVVRVPGTQATTTSVVIVSPFAGTGLGPASFLFVFSDTQGYKDLGVENILINNTLDGAHACYLAYSRPANLMYLVKDDGTALLPGQSLAASGSVSNSQCSVAWGSTPVAASGNSLSLNLSITFTSSFGGNRIVYVATRDVNEANSTGWDAMGTWTPQ